MQSTLQLPLVSLFLCLSFSLSAQFAQNFEALDHTHYIAELGAMKVHDGNIYYVSHNATKPMTTVQRLSRDKEMETILELPHFYTKSELFVDDDSNFQLVVYQLVDYDVILPGMYVINVNNDEIQIDSLLTLSNLEHNEVINNIQKDNQGKWLTIGPDSLRYFDTDGLASFAREERINYYSDFKTDAGEIFFLQMNGNNDEVQFYKLDGNRETLALTISATNPIEVLSQDAQGNYFLIEDKIVHYSVDMATIIDSWVIIQSDNRELKLHRQNNQLVLLSSYENNYTLTQLEPNGVITELHSANNREGEKINSFLQLDNEQYLFTGSLEGELTTQLFFRNENIVDNATVEYPRVDLALRDFEIIQTAKDTAWSFEGSNGETVHVFDYSYDLSITVDNRSSENVSISHLHSSPFNNDFRFDLIKNKSLTLAELESNSSLTIDTTITVFQYAVSDLSFEISGANYMFNNNPNRVTTTKVISSTTDQPTPNLLLVYPNPTHEFLHIQQEEPIRQVTIYDAQGQLVYYSTKNERMINVAELPAGIYTIILANLNSNQRQAGIFSKQ